MKNKEFKLKNLFNIFGSKYFSPKKLEDGTTPFLDKTQLNNGIVRTVNARNEKLNLGNAITIGDHSAIAFYQEEPFLTSDHMNKLYLKPEFGILNRNIALYLCTEINNQIKGRYNYSFILAKNRCENIIISLPVDSNGKPDWKYMEESVKQLEESVKQKLKLAIPQLNDIDTSNWKEFKIGELFLYEKAKGFKISGLIEGNIPYIARVAINNGVSRTAGNNNMHYPCNTITIHHEWKYTWVSFYQSKEYVTDGMIGILKPKFDLNEKIGLFLTTLINLQPANGAVSEAKKISIFLPVDSNGKPDWKYMEEYMTPLNQI